MPKQTSFAGGQVSAKLEARSDLAIYKHALRRARNCLITPHGAWVSRPGTQYYREVKTSSNGAVRLVPFIYSDTFSYLLEFGHGYVRVHRVTQGSANLPSWIAELTTFFATSDLPKLKFSQVGDVLTVTGSAFVYEIIRGESDVWSIQAINFTPRAAVFPDVINRPPAISAATVHAEVLPTHPKKEWIWKVSALLRDASGTVFETKPYTVTTSFTGSPPAARVSTALPTDNMMVVYQDKPVRIDWTSGGNISANYELIAWLVYRGSGQAFGYIGETQNHYFDDFGQAPDYTRGPQEGRNPFIVYDTNSGSWSPIGGHYPLSVAHFEDRRVFGFGENWGLATYMPGTIWLSATGDYANLDRHVPVTADDGMEVAIASRFREQIRWLLGMQHLIVGTNDGIWSVGGGAGEALDPGNVQALKHSGIGTALLDPLVINNSILYVRSKGVGIRELIYDLGKQAWSGRDLTFLTEDLFDLATYQVNDWCYQEDPWGVIWMARKDGKLVCMTYSLEVGISAITWGDTENGAGFFESVCAIPDGTEDRVFAVVRRIVGGTTKRYIERVTTRKVVNVEDYIGLDCSISYSGAATTTVTGLGHLEGKQVYALADGRAEGPFTVSGGAITINVAATKIHVGLLYKAQMEPLDVPDPSGELATKRKTVRMATVNVEASRGLWIGEDEASLYEADPTATTALATKKIEHPIQNSWNDGGRIFIEQRLPLPLTILSITRDLDVGER